MDGRSYQQPVGKIIFSDRPKERQRVKMTAGIGQSRSSSNATTVNSIALFTEWDNLHEAR